jgi:hypothetical protein
MEKELRKSRTVTVFMMWTNNVHIYQRQFISRRWFPWQAQPREAEDGEWGVGGVSLRYELAADQRLKQQWWRFDAQPPAI